jgi:hypothetical protein
MTQTSPPCAPVCALVAIVEPKLTIPVRDARVETKAIEWPSEENAGWKFWDPLLVTLTS